LGLRNRLDPVFASSRLRFFSCSLAFAAAALIGAYLAACARQDEIVPMSYAADAGPETGPP
jgi:hypothetical protein